MSGQREATARPDVRIVHYVKPPSFEKVCGTSFRESAANNPEDVNCIDCLRAELFYVTERMLDALSAESKDGFTIHSLRAENADLRAALLGES